MAERNFLARLILKGRDESSSVLRGFRGRLAGIGKFLGDLRQNTLNLKTALLATFSAAFITKFFKSALSASTDFQAQMARVRSVLVGTPEEVAEAFGKVEQAAKDLGQTTSFSATEAAQAMEILIRAGLNAEQAIGAVPAVLNASIGATIELADSAERITDVAANLSLKLDAAGTNSTRIADVLSLAAATAATSFSQLSDAVNRSGQAAVRSNIDLEALAGINAKLADNGIRAAEAGTAVRNLLEELQNPASKARQELAKFGDTTGDVFQLLDTLASAGNGSANILRGFTVEARTAAGILAKIGREDLQAYIQSLREADGASAKAAATVGGVLSGAFKALESAFDAAQRRLTDPLLKPIETEIRAFSEELGRFINSGGLDDFAASLVAGFKKASTAVREFLSEVDLVETARRIGEFSKSAIESLAGLANAARVAGNIVSLALNGMQVAFNLAAGAVNFLLGRTEAADRQFANFERNVREAAADVDALSQQLFGAADGFDQLGQAAKSAADEQVSAVDQVLAGLENVTQASRDAAIEYAKVLQAEGNENARTEALQRFADTLINVSDQATNAKESIAGIGPEAAESALTAEEAFKRLGIVSEEQTQNLLANYKAAFDRIKTDGSSTAEDIGRAFLALSEKQLAAAKILNNNQRETLQNSLRREAAELGIGVQLEKQIRQAERGLNNVRGLAQATEQAVDQTDELAVAAALVAEGFDGSVESVNRVTKALELSRQAIERRRDALQQETAVIEENTEVTEENAQSQAAATASRKEIILDLSLFVRNLSDWNQRMRDWLEQVATINGQVEGAFIELWFKAIEKGTAIVDDQVAQLRNWREQLSGANETDLPEIIRLADSARNSIRLISEETMQPFLDELAKAKERLLDFAQSVEAEVRRLVETEEERRIREFEELLARIRIVAETDAQLARELEREAREHHENELKRIRERIEAREREGQAANAAASGGQGNGGVSVGAGAGVGAGAEAGGSLTPGGGLGGGGVIGLPGVVINIEGVLDVNDPITLDSLARKLQPIFNNTSGRLN